MLFKIVEDAQKQRGGVVTKTGTCRFCGQTAAREALEEWQQEEIDELVTETCECLEARLYANEKGQKERANERIDLLFGKQSAVAVKDAAVDLLHRAVDLICEGSISAVTIDIGNGVKAKINITSKGFIKVTRTKTDTSAYEA